MRAWSPEHLELHRQLRRQPNLLPQGATLLLAVSGGQDSMALLGLLLGLQRLHGWQLLLWHGDHGWRPESSQQAAELQTWCSERGLNLQCEQRNQPASPTPAASEAAARAWRYQALEQCAVRHRCSRVVTGHTASDRAETLLLHLARGSHRRGMASLRSLRPLNPERHADLWLCRPLLSFSREDTHRICHMLELPIWLDSSNADCRYSRNRLRHAVLPVLEELHPGATRRLSRSAERLQREHEAAGEWVQIALNWLRLDTPHSELQLNRTRLVQLHPVNQAAVLDLWLGHQGIRLARADTLEALVQRLQQGQRPGQIHLAGGWRLQWNRSTLELIAATIPAP